MELGGLEVGWRWVELGGGGLNLVELVGGGWKWIREKWIEVEGVCRVRGLEKGIVD